MTDVAPWQLLLAAVVGYGFGAVNPASIIARFKGVDLRGSGSGNPGATNAGRVMGTGTGILVAVLDILKGLLPTLLFLPVGVTAAEVAGFAAVLGHITSPFLRGRGGKGVATTLGAVLGTHAIWVPFVLAGFAVGYLASRRMGIGSAVGSLVLVGCGVLAPEPDAKVFGIALGLLVLSRHRANIEQVIRDLRGRDPGITPPD